MSFIQKNIIPSLKSSSVFTPNKIENVIFINKRLNENEQITKSINETTYYLVYEPLNTYEQILSALEQFKQIKRIAFMFALNSGNPQEQYFVNQSSFFSNEFLTSICKIIKDSYSTQLN